MTTRDLSNTSIDERKGVMRSALLTDAVETLLANKARDTLQEGEAHIVIETENTDEGLNVMMSCVASLSPTNKVGIVLSLMRSLGFSSMEVIVLMMMARDLVKTDRQSYEDMLGDMLGKVPTRPTN